MSFSQRQIKILLAGALALAVMVVLFANVRLPSAKAQGVSEVRFRNVRVDGITNLRGAVMMGSAVTMNDTLDVADDATVGGDLVVTGVITTEGGYVGITPVATATAQPHWCGTQNVTGSATVIPATLAAAGITTPRAPVASLGADITLDGDNVTTSNASGVVTLKVWQLRTAATTTPQAATTAIAVNYCVDGN